MSIPSYRMCTPGETFERVSPFLRRLGITRVSSQTGLDKIGIPVWCAYAPNAKAIVIAQGKGLDDMAARTSATMEAIERSVATHPHCRTLQASLSALQARGDRVDGLASLIAAGAEPPSPDTMMDWVEAFDLISGEPVWLPFEAIHLDRSADGRRYWQSSDGLASGNINEEAIFHALLERVERDALTLWQLGALTHRMTSKIDPETLGHPELDEMLARIEKAGLQVALFDVTSNLGIPCISAILGPRDPHSMPRVRHVDITLGCGAALQPELAASRAISEAVQSRMTFIAGARDDLLPSLFDEPVVPEHLASLAWPAVRPLADLPRFAAGSAAEGLQSLLTHLRTKGIGKLYAVDLGPDWLPVSVVKVIAPQLENPEGDRRQRLGARALRAAMT